MGRKFTAPDDDWFPPLVVMQSVQGNVIVGGLMGPKEIWTGLLVRLIKTEKAVKVARIESAWTLTIKNPTPEQERVIEAGRYPTGMVPSEHSDRQELLAVSVFDQERAEMWFAPIRRTETKPPTWGSWQHHLIDAGAQVEPIIQALR